MPPWEKYQKQQPEGPWKKYQGSKDTVATGTVPVQGSIMGDIGIGLARAGAGTVAEIGDVLPTIGPSTEEARGMLHKFAGEKSTSPWQLGGEVAGNVAPFLLQPEVGIGRLLIRATPYVATLAGLAEAYRRHGMTGLGAAIAGLGGASGLAHMNPKLAAIARAARKYGPRAAQVGGNALEKGAAGAATTYYRQGGDSDKDRERRPEEPRKPPVQSDRSTAERPRERGRDNIPPTTNSFNQRWARPEDFQ